MYKAAIIGLGRMGHFFETDKLNRRIPCTHTGAYKFLEDKVELVSACDLREDRLNLYRNFWGVDNLYSDYKEMLENENIDILSVSTHAKEHKEIVIEAANSGVKAILCEKPISTNLKDAQDMIDACKKTGSILYINHTRRFDDQWRKVKEIIDNGDIGELTTINAYSSAGLLNGGSHLFDLLRFYNGEVSSVYAKIKKDESTDPSGFGVLEFKNGTNAFVDIDFRDYVLFQINLLGYKGFIRIGGMIRGDKSFGLGVSEHSPTQVGVMELKNLEFPEVPVTQGRMPLVNAINEIIESIETGKEPSSSGEDGLAALEIAMAFYESNFLNKPIKLPLENRLRVVIPRETSYTKDGRFPISYSRDNILPLN